MTLAKEWLDYGMGMFALIILSILAYKLIEWRGKDKGGSNTSSPSSEVITALNRNSEAITRFTQLLEMQFEFDKERRAEDRVKMEKIQETLDEILRRVIEQSGHAINATDAIKAIVEQQVGKLRADIRAKEV
jgi:biopolymer transport protein ExbB/TolQ